MHTLAVTLFALEALDFALASCKCTTNRKIFTTILHNLFLPALPMISIINEERSWKELDNIPKISIAFPNGHFDNLVLDRFYPSAESRKIGKPHCNFIGHLENELTACVAVTGCYGVGNVEFTIKSRHLSSI